MLDPRFARTVIYVYEHSRGGALGLVVNKPVGIIEAESLAEQLGILEEVEPPHQACARPLTPSPQTRALWNAAAVFKLMSISGTYIVA